MAVLAVCFEPLRVGAWWTLVRRYADDSPPDVVESFCSASVAGSAWRARGHRRDLLDVGRSARGLHLKRSVAIARNPQVVIPWTAIESRTGDGRREMLAIRAGSGTVYLSLPAGFIAPDAVPPRS
ncbi:MAG TPA: hypothetical protein VH083_14190 [Myxococcales bacterium]|nr:hypothetical protein [Myxococcales bacterium]